MKNRQLHRVLYQLKHRYFTLNNVVIGVAFLIAAGWAWGSLGVMQRNYGLQRTLERKSQELQLVELQAKSLELEQSYYKTREYQELAVRDKLGLGASGEKVLILPKQAEKTPTTASTTHTETVTTAAPGNFEQWMDFLFGHSE